ncbi:MAG: EAL domain-containing protein [Gammaproteobacteria bacterium]|nr:EAL domain-containing protein [Gammaproteobacteria bacterium]MDH5799814.1 EAL domain-containing protein [Gammaproteobacteria bacterium]
MYTQLNIVKGINKGELTHLKTVPGEGIFALDTSGELVFMNHEAEQILGWNSDELQGHNFFQRLKFKMDASATIGSSKCAALHSVSCSHLQMAAMLNKKDGETLPISYIALPMYEGGRMVGKLYVFKESRVCKIGVDYRELLESSCVFLIKIAVDGRIIFANSAAKKVFGARLHSVLPSKIQLNLQENSSLIRQQTLTNRVKTKDGMVRTIAWGVTPLYDKAKAFQGVICSGTDISEQDQASTVLFPEQILSRKVFEQVSDGIIVFDQKGIVEYLNPTAERMTGWNRSDARQLLLSDVFQLVDEHTRKPIVNTVLRRAREIDLDAHQPRAVLLRRDGMEYNIEETVSAIRDHQGVIIGGFVVFKDVGDMTSLERWMNAESRYDALTTLINRTEFETRLTKAISSAKYDGHHHALCYIDMGGFRSINKHYGEQAGDELLKYTASLLSSSVKDTDYIGRIGGDEFGVLLRKCSLDNAKKFARELRQSIHHTRFIWREQTIPMRVSIGLVPITSTCGGLGDVMRIADAACYVAKNKGNNKWHAYKASDIALSDKGDQLRWIHKIRRALDQDHFRLFCQSIVPLSPKKDKQVMHHEILLRLIDENGEVYKPASFIGIAEKYNLMPSIDRWVVRTTLNLLHERLGRTDQLGVFSINLSAQSLEDENFLNFVIDQLDQSDVPAECICFEITESTAISNLMVATRYMAILRGMGCRFSLDDFGRGFSSYAYLKNLHLDYLKIDGCFVRDLADDPVDRAMVDSINQIGHMMGIETIAEFVESEEALQHLMQIGVDHVQGFQIGKPRPMWPTVVDEAIIA